MRIEYIQISNILSFPYCADISEANKIEFSEDLNIIIGENGSGKSTALEVINFLFRKIIFRQFIFNQDAFENRSSMRRVDWRNILQPGDHEGFDGFRLNSNWDSSDKEQCIRISLRIDEVDQENITNILNHIVEINQIAEIYSVYTTYFNNKVRDRYVIDVMFRPSQNKDDFLIKLQNGEKDLGFQYITDYHFFKQAIFIHNTLGQSNLIPPLLESFTLISSYRNYNALQVSINLSGASVWQQSHNIQGQDFKRSLNHIDTNEPSVFGLVRLRAAGSHINLMPTALDRAQCEIEANNLPFMRSINERLRVVNLRFQIKLVDLRTWQYRFECHDTRRNKLIDNINSLSAGQKSIVHLVFEAYGRGELKGGVIIIDEPEIHLHYQFQHEYLKLIRELNQAQKCQYILVTHSESLINSRTISSVRRFALDARGHTSIFSPQISADERSLIKILDNTRSTYAFFSKKVVLVEGDTDRYFFRALIQERYPSLEQEISVLHVGGKAEFPKWQALFSSFGLRVYVIADFDYLFDLCYRQVSATSLQTTAEINKFKQLHHDWEINIDHLITKDIFLLRGGALENYLCIPKGLNHVIDFCQNKLQQFLKDDSSSESREMRSIIDTIADQSPGNGGQGLLAIEGPTGAPTLALAATTPEG